MYLIGFVSVVNEAAVLTPASDVLLLECSKAAEFSTLIFVSYKLLSALEGCLYINS